MPFVIVGGHAVNFHGFRRATEDIDIVWLRSPESEAGLAKALADIGAHYIGKDIDPATGIERTHPVTPAHIRTMHLMMLWCPQGFLDLFDYIPGFPTADVGEVFRTATEADGLHFVSLDWLLSMKKAAGRSKDLLDLEKLQPKE